MRRIYFGVIGLAMFVIGLSQGYDWPGRSTISTASGPSCAGAIADGASLGGPFELIDQDGETVRDTDLHGKYQLIYFGFTYCPDTCPVALESMSAALDMTAPDVAAQIQPVFISVDPERDTPAAVKDYIGYFHEDFIGLTGTPDQVKQAADGYGVYYAKAPAEPGDDPQSYLINHVSIIYLMGKDGAYLTHFTHNASPEKMSSALQSCISSF